MSLKALVRLVYRLPFTLLFPSHYLRRYARADDVFVKDGIWYIEWLRDGMSLRGSKAVVVCSLIVRDIRISKRVIRSAVHHLTK